MEVHLCLCHFALGAVYFVYVLFLAPSASRSKPTLQLNTMLAGRLHDRCSTRQSRQRRVRGRGAVFSFHWLPRQLKREIGATQPARTERPGPNAPASCASHRPTPLAAFASIRCRSTSNLQPDDPSGQHPSRTHRPPTRAIQTAHSLISRPQRPALFVRSPSPSRARRRKESGRLHSASQVGLPFHCDPSACVQ